MRRVPFAARCRQGWCQNWERCDGHQHPQWRKAIAISGKKLRTCPCWKRHRATCDWRIRLFEEAAASRDAVMPRPGGTRPAALLEIRLYVRLLQGTLVILVLKHTSQFRSLVKWVLILCFCFCVSTFEASPSESAISLSEECAGTCVSRSSRLSVEGL